MFVLGPDKLCWSWNHPKPQSESSTVYIGDGSTFRAVTNKVTISCIEWSVRSCDRWHWVTASTTRWWSRISSARIARQPYAQQPLTRQVSLVCSRATRTCSSTNCASRWCCKHHAVNLPGLPTIRLPHAVRPFPSSIFVSLHVSEYSLTPHPTQYIQVISEADTPWEYRTSSIQ